MEFSDDSDIDSTVTPIQPQDDVGHGLVLSSDSDVQLHMASQTKPKQRKPNRSHHRSDNGREKSSADTGGQRSQARRAHQYLYSHDQPDLDKGHLKEIYKELEVISEKLKEENRILHERETSLKERERMLSISQENLKTVAELEVKQRVAIIEENYKTELARLEASLKEKSRENKRLKDNFETLKMANDAQKKELESLKQQHEKLEKQSLSVQARLTNLQRKQDFEQRQREADLSVAQPVAVPKTKPTSENPADEKERPKSTKSQKIPTTTYEVLSTLLDWVSDSQLRYTTIDTLLKPVDLATNREFLQEKVIKILPALVEMLREFPGHNLKLCLPCLQFTYWSLVHVEQAQGQQQQKSNLSSTFRRLGEELYRSKTVRFYDTDPYTISDATTSPVKTDKNREGIYFRSSNQHVRLISSLIILRTLSQVDLLAHVFDVLKADLKSDVAKELFLYYQGTTVVLQFLKPVNKPFMSPAMDIFLQMSTDSPFLPPFLESCSNETWFRTVAMVLRAPRPDTKLLERLSIVLQKLSKSRANKRFFEVYTITGIIQELLRTCSNDQAFLALNLKSILYNLNSAS
ncbi:coiled-coil domain-containing protein 138-like isoform X1 [Dreissena polymorpha]|uniref:coiled-coil domain-containing protein 138-like isoform X1 n=1 Tax=Dreissena polymorpha TaxID=45954 RepID=UPI002263E9EC|nr:coiled-coil domain-containing protein 138-like isoform X1 [Dreissena polymorpha]XP_052282388.1 coiled-coil domain-containing protein 138-like isoform X1 [Dreissena polymorpha]XP_052282389.1 coiled-coil domain-containing protein 138-like isoform X1 [Dreissena polymorpha]